MNPEAQARGRQIEQEINETVHLAWDQGRPIDDLTAKRIAQFIEPGSGPLHEFVETGAITPDMGAELQTAGEGASGPQQIWVAALGDYCRRRRRKEPIGGWGDMEPAEN